MTGPTLHVVTHRRWVADDFTAALAATDIAVRHHHGLDLPDLHPGDALWAPMEWAARARHAGATWHLADPGPHFTPALPTTLTGRTIHHTTLGALTESLTHHHAPATVFAKPANAKIDTFPAKPWTQPDLLAHTRGLPDDTAVHWTPTILDLDEEHRVFILDRHPVTSSIYLRHPAHPGDPEEIWHETMTTPHTDDATTFAKTVLDHLTGPLPRTFTLDIARTRTGTWIVLETNPTWCAAQYGARLTAVTDCLLAATDPNGGHDWTPDPWLVHQANRQRRLTR